MKIIERIKEYLIIIFNKNKINYLESAKEEKNVYNNNCNTKKEFKDSLRLNVSQKSHTSLSHSVIETLECINDGLGFQKLNK